MTRNSASWDPVLEEKYLSIFRTRHKNRNEDDFEKWYKLLGEVIETICKGFVRPDEREAYKISVLQDLVMGGYPWVNEVREIIFEITDAVYRGDLTPSSLFNPKGELEERIRIVAEKLSNHYTHWRSRSTL